MDRTSRARPDRSPRRAGPGCPSPRSPSGRPRACGAGAAWGRSRPAWTSHLQDDRQHDGPAPETLIDEVTDGRAHRRADQLLVRRRVGVALGVRGEADVPHLLVEILVVL